MKMKAKAILAAAITLLLTMVSAIVAQASDPVTFQDLGPAFTDGINSLIQNILGLAVIILPLILGYMAIMLAIGWGMKFFRRVGSSAT